MEAVHQMNLDAADSRKQAMPARTLIGVGNPARLFTDNRYLIGYGTRYCQCGLPDC